jgi:hypothetical protein
MNMFGSVQMLSFIETSPVLTALLILSVELAVFSAIAECIDRWRQFRR